MLAARGKRASVSMATAIALLSTGRPLRGYGLPRRVAHGSEDALTRAFFAGLDAGGWEGLPRAFTVAAAGVALRAPEFAARVAHAAAYLCAAATARRPRTPTPTLLRARAAGGAAGRAFVAAQRQPSAAVLARSLLAAARQEPRAPPPPPRVRWGILPRSSDP